nr:hypothetical protein [Tanacetum cinerariifolium]
MLHICLRIPGQSFDEPPFEEEILEFLRFLRHSAQIRTLTDVNINKLFHPWRSFGAVINKCLTGKSFGFDSFRLSQAESKEEQRDVLPQIHKGHHTSLHVKGSVNPKTKQEYYACATGEEAPKPKASARRKRSDSNTSITPPTAITTSTITVGVAPRLTATTKGKQLAKAKSDEKDESDDEEEDDDDDKDGDENDDDDDDDNDEEEIAKIDEQDDTERGGDDNEESESDEESDDEETKEKESFNPIPRTPEDSEDDGNNELYRDVDINQGRGLPLSQDIEDSYVTRTLVNPDGQQESSSMSSQFVTSMLNPTSDAGMESIFTTASSPVAPLQTSTPIMTPSTIATISTISHAPIPPTTIPSEVKGQVKEQVLRILLRIEQSVNAQLEAKVLTRSSHSSRTLYAVAADLSEMELKKILIDKMEGNKSIQRSDEQRNLYKALVEAYEANKIILDTYRETVTLKRRRDDESDKDEGPSAGLDRGTLPAVQGSTQTWISELAKQADSRSSFNKLLDTPLDFSNFIMNRLRVDTLTPELLAGPTFDLMKGSCTSLIELEYHLEEVYKATTDQLDWVNPEGQQYPHNLLQPLPLILNNRGRRVIPFAHFINNDLEYLQGGASSRKYTTSVTKTKAADYRNIKWIEDLFYGFAINRESALDVYSKKGIIAVTNLKIVEWHRYKHLDWITVRRDDDKLYKFKEGDFYRLRLQDIEDMLLLLVQGKLSNLTVESDLKRREAYTAYLNPRGFIYQNKDKKNRLMRIDELHKFSDGTLNDVRNALDDHLKGIRMLYLPQTIWRKGDKDRAAAMIQAIDKMLKTMRIMRSLERFIGGRLYEGDFWMLQRTI